MDQQEAICDRLTARRIPVEVRIKLQALILLSYADLGCLLTSIEEEYEYFYHEVFSPERFGFRSWSDVVNTVPELSIKSLKGHRVIVSEPLGRQAVTSLLTQAFFQGDGYRANPARDNVSRNEISTQTEPLPPILIVKEEPVVKVEAPDNSDADVTSQEEEVCQIIANEQLSTNAVPPGFINCVQNNVPNMGTRTTETSTNKENLVVSHNLKLNQDDSSQKRPSFESIKNLTFDDFASLARKNTENDLFPKFPVAATSTTTYKKRKPRRKGKGDDKRPPEAADEYESSINVASGAKRPRVQGISEAEEQQRTDRTVLIELMRSALVMGSKRCKTSMDSNPPPEELSGSYFNDSQVGYRYVGPRTKQTARRSTGPSTVSRFRSWKLQRNCASKGAGD